MGMLFPPLQCSTGNGEGVDNDIDDHGDGDGDGDDGDEDDDDTSMIFGWRYCLSICLNTSDCPGVVRL